ncbi:glycine rich domain-containing protein [Blautia wexlerae]|uniref:glycine rich domain-containing protein n=1 Tax=Blautia wexlerae TaxID=418240 RepID=UPI0034A5684D
MSNIKTGDILNFNYTGAVQSITLPKGTYKLECWGAQGGNRSQDSASATVTGSGLGGYSIGTLTLTQLTTCYIYVGGQGGMSSSTGNVKVEGGFNGGGFASHESTGEPGNGGGGATDVRIAQDSLYARVIVAGGGGGSGEDNETGGYGGGETGGAGSGNTSLTQASQTSGGTNSFGFGLGGNTYNGGAGGGGWYGGASRYSVSSYSNGSDSEGGGGGSGYVYTSSTAKNYPSGCLLNSSYYLSNAQTIAGNNSFASPTGSSETGHSGNGYCRITVIECKNTALYTRINNSMKKATAFYFKLNNNKMYGIGSANSNGAVMNFDYTGSVQTTTLTPGRYKLECWGAQGGNSDQSNGTYGNGGKGGYSTGILNVSTNTTIYITVGGQGQNGVLNTRTAGGFNGGGDGYGTNNSGVGGGGGGASDISLMSPVFSHSSYFINNIRDTNSLLSRIIVAGGGGSAGYNVSNNAANGGAGGGTTGQDGLSNRVYHGTGGKQTTFGTGGSSEEPNRYSVQAKFGCGASASNSTDVAPGGGGGWYGGGLHCDSAGGGSGYVYTPTTASNYPSGCLLNSAYYLSNAQTIAGDQSFPAPSGSTETGHSGNGHVKITKLSDVIYLTHAKNNIMDFNYTGSVQSKTLKPGTYTIECWGGQGGTYSSYIGGYGGYSKGTITLTEATTVYISVGGAGSSSSTAAGFNGGGTGISSGRGGGGATDVRIGQNSLYSRVIVAGGGGGAGVTSANANPCGCGGGEYGGDGYYNDTTGSYTIGQNRCGGSASQTAGDKTWSTSTQATFGQGGNASGYSCGGGGGGWYGGGGAYDSDSDSDGRWGGGGSGYVYTSSTAKNYPNGCLLNSTHYLTNAQTIAGNTSFTSPTGSAETGHTGSGFCRITNLNPTQYGLYVKTNSGWKHIDL